MIACSQPFGLFDCPADSQKSICESARRFLLRKTQAVVGDFRPHHPYEAQDSGVVSFDVIWIFKVI